MLASAAAAGTLVVWAGPAWAHASLDESQPFSGQTFASGEGPREIVLRFTEPVDVGLGGVRVFDGRGNAVDAGTPRRDGREVRAALGALPDGGYAVTWRVTSADGHPIQGAFTFGVGAGAGDLEDPAFLDQLLSSQGADTAVGVVWGAARALAFAGVLLLVGGTAFLVLAWPTGVESATVRGVLGVAWIAAFVSAVVGFGVQGAYAAGGTLADALDPDVLSEVLDTRVGRAWLARALVLLAALPVLRRFETERPSRLELASVGATGVALVATLVAAGHATSGRWVPLALPVDFVHLAAVALWLGGLAVVAAGVLRRDAPPPGSAEAVSRFSDLAFVAVLVFTGTGLVQSWRQAGSLDALLDTDFGRLLLLKVGCVAGIVIVASASRQITHQWFLDAHPALTDAGEPAPGGVETVAHTATLADTEVDPEGVRRLRGSVRLELVLAAVVLALTALLVNAPPGREALAGAAYHEVLRADGLAFDVLVTPAESGVNEIHLTVLSEQQTLVDVLEVEAGFTEEDRGVGPLDVAFRRLGTGHFVGDVALPFSGRWRLRVAALVTETEQVVVEADVEVA